MASARALLSLLVGVSLRHARLAPLRTLLTVLGVGLGVATAVAILGINRAVLEAFRSTVDTIAGKADLTIAGSQAGFDDELVERIRATPGVAHASGALSQVVPVAGREGERLLVLGVDFLDDGHFRPFEGRGLAVRALADDLAFLNSTDRLLLSERYARERGLRVGDSLTLVTGAGRAPFVIHGLLRDDGPARAFGGALAVMYVGSAQVAFSRERRIDRIEVAVSEGGSVDDVAQRLRSTLGAGFEVERPSRRGSSVARMLGSFQLGLNLGSVVALLVGVFLVYNTVSIGVVQRRREIGTLRALGASRRAIRSLFTLEATVFGLLGAMVGLPLGVALARGALGAVVETVSSLYVQVNPGQLSLSGLEVTLGVALGLSSSVLAALWPAAQASSVAPIEALRREPSDGGQTGGRTRLRLTVAGIVMIALAVPLSWLPPPIEGLPLWGDLAVGVVMVGAALLSQAFLLAGRRLLETPATALLGVSGRLAVDNLLRSIGRSAVPVSALSVGVAMTVCIAGFVGSFQRTSREWVEQSIPADLFVTSSAALGGVRNTPMRPALGEELAQLPGVEHVDRVRLLSHDVLGLRVYIIAHGAQLYRRVARPSVIEGSLPTLEQQQGGYITVSENLMRRRGLHAGMTIPIATPTGLRVYRIAAVVADYTSDQGTIFLDQAVFAEHFRDDWVDTFELYLTPGFSVDKVRGDINRRFGELFNLYVLSNRELRQEAHDLFEQAFAVTYAMEAVAVLLALLGVINTLLAAVLDRTREIGLLRAIGAARGHVVRMFCAEAGLIGFAGGALGALSGLVMGVILTRVVGLQATGWSVPFTAPVTVCLHMLLAATVCAVIAGLYPAWRAARLDVVEALAYE